MSLGLGDLKKKNKSPRVVKSSDFEADPTPHASPARPWSNEGLKVASLPDDAATMEVAPLFYVDLSSDTRLAKVEETLVKIEERVTRALERPLKAAQHLFPKFFAQ